MNLSIIIPVYNPPHNLFEDNIKSLTKECEDFELIYLNDGSTHYCPLKITNSSLK